jgi:hypothetical protein
MGKWPIMDWVAKDTIARSVENCEVTLVCRANYELMQRG